MGNAVTPSHCRHFFQLILRGRRPQALVLIDDDWRALGDIVTRMLFWCGGHIYGCRCEANEMRLAVQVAHAPIGAMAQHISGAYAMRMRRLRGWRGSIFKAYTATPLPDESHLVDLVRWLHRASDSHVWTAASAYLAPHSPTGATRRPDSANDSFQALRPDPEAIARVVAAHCGVSLQEMRSASRRRAASKARVIATVLCTRNGVSVAAAARLFRRSRSTLTERAEHYRRTEPQMFAEAERALSAYLETDEV